MADVQQLAAVAFHHFSTKAYDDALATLEKLKHLKDSDPRIRHNIAVVQYYRDGCAHPQQLLESLTEGQLKNDARDSAKPDISTNGSPKPVVDADDSSFTSLQSAYLSYNKALIYFQLRQYSYSLELLEGLFPTIEALPEDLAIKTSFFLIEVYHLFKQPAKIAHIITHLEKNYANQSSTQKGANDSQSNTSFSSSEFNLLLQLYKLKLCIATKDFAQANRVITTATDSLSHISATETTSLSSLASTTLAFLKANLEYARGNYPKAQKLLNGAQKKGGSDSLSETALHNDKGCIYYRLQKYSASSFSLSKALKEHISVISDEKNRKNLSVFSQERRDELFYSQGLQLLLTGNAELAFQCFHEAALSYYRKPKLWLRMAECCIAAYLSNMRKLKQNSRSSFVHDVVTHEDEARHVILPTEAVPQLKNTGVKGSSLSLEYGQECLRNALFLLSRASAASASTKEAKNETAKASNESEEASDATTNSTSTSLDIPDKRHHLRDICLLNMAFIALSSEDPVVAHAAASEVISNTTSPDARFLAHVYAAESLCLLNRPVEAASHLSPSVLVMKSGSAGTTSPLSPHSTNTAPANNTGPSADSVFSRWHPQRGTLSVSDARYALHINLACVHILQDKIVQAQKCLSQAITFCPTRHEGILLLVYIELCKGNTNGALDILRRGRSAGLHINALLTNSNNTPNTTTLPNAVKTESK